MNNKDKLFALLMQEAGLGDALPQEKTPLNHEAPSAAIPLTLAQKRLWYLQLLDGPTNQYNNGVGLRFTGEVDLQRLSNALERVLERHEALRTVVRPADEHTQDPVQNILPAPSISLTPISVNSFAEARSAGEVFLSQVFDLSKDIPFRARLYTIRPDAYFLTLAQHHIATDGWSLGIILHDLMQAYSHASLPEQKTQYKEYALWEQGIGMDMDMDKPHAQSVAYWKEKLSNASLYLDFPYDHNRPTPQCHQAAYIDHTLPPELMESVTTLAVRQNTTKQMVLLAAFSALLSTYSGQQDIILGLPTANRGHQDFEDVVGLFTNTIPLLLNYDSSISFQEHLQAVTEETLTGLTYGDAPFEAVVEAVNPDRTTRHAPIYQVMFAYQSMPITIPQLDGLECSCVLMSPDTLPTDMHLHLEETGNSSIHMRLLFNRSLLENVSALRLLENYERLLSKVLHDPARPMGDLDWVAEEQKGLVLHDWQGKPGIADDATLVSLLAQQVSKNPNATALVTENGDSLSYGELWSKARDLAWTLEQSGWVSETPVALSMPRSVELVIGMAGTMLSGAPWICLDPALPEMRRQYMLEHAKVTHMVNPTNTSTAELFPGVFHLSMNQLQQAPEGYSPAGLATRPDAPAYIIYTSGSTGHPKGVVGLHRGMVNRLRWGWSASPYHAEERCCLKTAPSFVDWIAECLSPLLAGCPAYVLPPNLLRNPIGLIDHLADHKITRFLLVPSLLRTLIESAPDLGKKLPHLRHWTTSGEALPADMVKTFAQACPKATLLNIYGSSEVSADVTCHVFHAGEMMDDETGTAPIGAPLPNTNVYVLDQKLRPLPPGVPGKLYVSGVHLAQGYLHAPDLTSGAFLPSPFTDTPPHHRLFHTGDRGRFTHDGQLEFLGRSDFIITLHGLRIDPGEVEAHLRSHPGISQALVAVQRSTVTGTDHERLVAFIQLHNNGPAPTAEDVHAHLAARIPATMIPHQYAMLDQLPLLPNGKLNRRGLPDAQGLPSLPGKSCAPQPRTPMEKLVADAWRHVLGQPPTSMEQSFFHAGGHSLLAIRMAADLTRTTGREVLGTHVFSTPTAGGLARTIEALHGKDDRSPIVPLDHGDTPPIAPSQTGLWLMHRMGNAGNYVMTSALHIRGPLDIASMYHAVQKVLERHLPLRTVYGVKDGNPHLRVLPVDAIDLHSLDLSAKDVNVRAMAVKTALNDCASAPMDLDREAPFRLQFVKADEQSWYLALSMHHIAFDGWSSHNLFAELRQAYAAYTKGIEPSLPTPALSYFDYAAWSQARLDAGELNHHLEYWKEKWKGAPDACLFPTDYPVPHVRDARGRIARFHIANEVARAVRDYAAHGDKSEYGVLLTVFAMLLSRACGNSEIVLGIMSAARPPETHNLIGLFANPLPVRLDMLPAQTVMQCLELVNTNLIETLTHESTPFDSIVQAVAPHRSRSRTPLFQTLFVYQNDAFDVSLNGLEVEAFHLDGDNAPYDLTMEIQQAGDGGYNLAITYATSLWKEESIAGIVNMYTELCRAVAHADSHTLWQKLPLCDSEEQERIIELSHGPQTVVPEKCVHQTILEHARSNPAALAVDGPQGSLTYAGLCAKAHGIAQSIRAATPPASNAEQSLVALCLPLCPDYICTWLGILISGSAILPLDPRWPADRIQTIMEQAEPVAYAGATPPAFELTIPFLDVTTTAAVTGSVSTQTQLHDLAYVVFTSGSTGLPKGVAVEHAGLANLAQAQSALHGVTLSTRTLLSLSPAFDVAMGELATILTAGGCIVTAPFENLIPGREYLEVIEQYSVSHMTLPASVLAAMPTHKAHELLQLKTIVCGGESLPVNVAETWKQGRALFNAYGPSETTVCAMTTEYKDPNFIGRPLPGVQALILDDANNVLPFGMRGELCLAGRGLARGYFRNATMTAASFVPHPLMDGARIFRTGDQARMDQNGDFHFMGRKDGQLKIRGVRVEPGETIATLESLPEVRQAVVLPVTTNGETQLHAWVTGNRLNPETILNDLRKRLPEALVPSRIIPLKNLPLTANGKVDTNALPIMDDVAPTPATGTEALPFRDQLASIWREVLGMDVRHDINFFDAGGHSLNLVKVQVLLQKRLNRKVDMVDLFHHTTITSLAHYLSNGDTPAPALSIPQRTTGQDIAIIGMACRYPDAPDIASFWNVIHEGRDTVRTFSREELLNAGVHQTTLDDPDFIPRQAFVDGIDLFDADFFGLSPSDAALLDPQHRIFLQCAYHAMEHGGYPGRTDAKNVAVFAGSGMNQYMSQMFPDGLTVSAEGFSAITGNDKDFLASRTAYLLNLTGPAVNVQTACSTSLVAVGMACEALRQGQADMALAGGVSLQLKPSGYVAREGLIFAKDGYCRAFDQDASGTVPGSGCGVVLLRPLHDALQANDTIYAVIKGIGLNNDGAAKAGFTAPGVEGQSRVIRKALHDAAVPPATLGYVETHGTGTKLGDPIEVAALQQAYATTPGEADIILGSIKANMGHADSAAGVAGLIKTALCLWQRTLPPTPHFTAPNPKLHLENTPFSLLHEARPWAEQPHPRRAGVSSFGIGGTNAHIILEETPRSADHPMQALQKPLHPFAQARHWREGKKAKQQEKRHIHEWFYAPAWQRTSKLSSLPAGRSDTPWLLFTDTSGLGQSLANAITARGESFIMVRPGDVLQRTHNGFELRPNAKEDYETLFSILKDTGRDPARVAYLWSLDLPGQAISTLPANSELDLSLYAFLWLARAMGMDTQQRSLYFITKGLHAIQGTENGSQLPSLGYHAAPVVSVEQNNVAVRCIDLSQAPDNTSLAEDLLKEILNGTETKVGLRGAMRYTPTVSPHPAPKPDAETFAGNGFWWITGGLGGMGLTFASRLSRDHGKKLLLTSRSGLPNRESWEILQHEVSPRGRAIATLLELETHGAEIMVIAADAADTTRMEQAFRAAKNRFGSLGGIIHTAGVADEAGVLRRRSRQATETVLAPKVTGTLILRTIALNEKVPLVLCSSLATLMPQTKFAQIGYAAANGFLDCLAERETEAHIITVNWHDWLEAGMTVRAEEKWRGRHNLNDAHMASHRSKTGLTNDEGWQALRYALHARMPRLIVSPEDLYRILNGNEFTTKAMAEKIITEHDRPDIRTQYTVPHPGLESDLAAIWGEVLGISRVGAGDDFFELGGHSLLGTRLSVLVRERLGLSLNNNAVFDTPILKDMALSLGAPPNTGGTPQTSPISAAPHGTACENENTDSGEEFEEYVF